MSGPKSVFAKCDNIIIWMAAKEAPAADEWQAYTDAVIELERAAPDSARIALVLVITDGGGPTSVQRTDFVAALGKGRVRTAVVSGNMLVRGIVTVFNWFKVENKIFAPKDVFKALEFLSVGSASRANVWATVERLAKQIGRVESVESARAYVRPNYDQAQAR
jgi:hypothetical protein